MPRLGGNKAKTRTQELQEQIAKLKQDVEKNHDAEKQLLAAFDESKQNYNKVLERQKLETDIGDKDNPVEAIIRKRYAGIPTDDLAALVAPLQALEAKRAAMAPPKQDAPMPQAQQTANISAGEPGAATQEEPHVTLMEAAANIGDIIVNALAHHKVDPETAKATAKGYETQYKAQLEHAAKRGRTRSPVPREAQAAGS